jgi:tRNA nucleotidyltransferase (CCA-adding enzyme)
LRVLLATGWVELYPELINLIGVAQDPRHHPEGDAWDHTMQVVDQAVQISRREDLDRMVMVLAGMCHDMGKVSTTEVQGDGTITSYGHDEAGVPLAESFLKRIGAPQEIIERVLPLVRNHMYHINFKGIPQVKIIRRLANKLKPSNIQEWVFLVEADASGRHPAEKKSPVINWLDVAIIEQCESGDVKPVLMGRDLIALGFKPGVQMGKILKEVFEAQLEGHINNSQEAIEWVYENLERI